MFNFLARVNRTELPDGSEMISLALIKDEEAVELADGDEFVTVELLVDPFDRSN